VEVADTHDDLSAFILPTNRQQPGAQVNSEVELHAPLKLSAENAENILKMKPLRPVPAPGGEEIPSAPAPPALPFGGPGEAMGILQTLVGASPLAIVAFDPEGVVTLWSPAAERTFGWSAEEALGQGLPFVPADRQEEFRALRQRALRGESFTEPALHRRRADGSPIVVSASIAPLRREDGTVYGILSLLAEVPDSHAAADAARGASASAGRNGERWLAGEAAPGTETVLLVEDVDTVRALAREILRLNGYTVIEARHAREALLLSEAHRGTIHLMLTDIVMPGMSGGELARRLRTQRPATRVLYMSGYADDAIFRHGVPEEEIAFLQKPFTAAVLSRKVRDVLDAP
jgi:PAS domain S-box-containing protein